MLKADTGAGVDFVGYADVLDGTVHAVSVDARLNSENGGHIIATGGELTLKGAIDFSVNTVINFANGTLNLDGSGFNFVNGMTISATALQGGTGADSAANAGLIDLGSTISGLMLTNTGVINQDSAGYFVIGGPGGATGTEATLIVNTNLIEATAGILQISGGGSGSGFTATTIDDTGNGTLSVGDGALIQLQYGAIVKGGHIHTTGTGYLALGDAVLDGTNPGGLTIDSGSSVSVNGVIVGDIVNDGTMTIAGTTLSIANGTTAQLNGSVSGSVVLTNGVIEGGVGQGGVIVGGGALAIGSNETVSGTGYLQDVALTNHGVIDANAAGTLYVQTGYGGASLDNLGKIEAHNGSGVSLSVLPVTNETGGQFIAYAGGQFNVASGQDFANEGALMTKGGTMVVSDAVTGAGSASIDGGLLYFGAAFSENVSFGPTTGGVLELTHAYSATISGFADGDAIDVTPFAGGDTLSYSSTGHTVTIASWDGSQQESLHFSATTDVSKIFLATATDSGAATVDQLTFCFMAGTMIRTPTGETPVEALKRDDLVLTADGRALPVSWLGRQTIRARFSDPLRNWPIRICRDALAENTPCRDLLLSPDHAVMVDGVLIHAGALVNGATILRERAVPETFVYYHVELDDHALILAENVPAETFIDTVDRMHFDNWDEHEALYPRGKPIEEMPYPRAKARRQVPMHIRAALDDRADTNCREGRTAAA
jgi:hypothetical protein